MPEHINNLVRLEIDASDAVNMITNHSGQNNSTAGWTGYQGSFGYTVGVPGHFNGRAFIMGPAFSGGTYFTGMRTASMAVAALDWMNMAVNISTDNAGNRVTLGFDFYNAGGTSLGTTSFQHMNIQPAEKIYGFPAPFQVPAQAATVRISIAVIGAQPGDVYVSRIIVVSSPTKSLVDSVTFADGPLWQNILGSGYNLNFRRGNTIDGVTEKAEIGTLSATLTDPLVDPTKNPRMRPGRRIRALSDTAGTGYTTIWQGKITTLDVNYQNKKPRISLAAVDTWSEVMNILSPAAMTGNLKQRIDYILSGKGVPYYVDPSGSTESFYMLDSQDNATALDQIEWATVAKNGFAFVGEQGRVEVWSYAQWNATMTYALTFSDNPADTGVGKTPYTDIDTNFGSQALTNSLMVNIHNLFEDDGAKSYGPYTNAASASAWGTKSATVETTDGEPLAIATNYLKTYANPEIFASSIKFNGRDAGHPLALYGLYYKANVKHSDSGLNTTYRIINIEHDITPDAWEVTVGFKPLEATAAVTVTNPPGGPNSGPGDLITPVAGPLASRTRSTAFSIATSGFVTTPLNNVVTADGIDWDSTNSRFVVPRDGRYVISGGVRFAANANGTRGVQFAVNGAAVGISVQPAGSIGVGPSLTKTIKLVAGDTVALQIYQNSGAALATDASTGTYMDIAYIGQ